MEMMEVWAKRTDEAEIAVTKEVLRDPRIIRGRGVRKTVGSTPGLVAPGAFVDLLCTS